MLIRQKKHLFLLSCLNQFILYSNADSSLKIIDFGSPCFRETDLEEYYVQCHRYEAPEYVISRRSATTRCESIVISIAPHSVSLSYPALTYGLLRALLQSSSIVSHFFKVFRHVTIIGLLSHLTLQATLVLNNYNCCCKSLAGHRQPFQRRMQWKPETSYL